jgi:RNA polymerase sigma-70 factor (ECF subfamily)
VDIESLFKEVFESHRDRIYRICCCYVRESDGRDDVYQEVLIQIWKNLHTFRGKSQIGTWIYRITVNTCLRYLETERRRNALFAGDPGRSGDGTPDPSESEEADENEKAVQRLYEAVNQLPAIDRILISLFLEDLSSKSIAEVLDISEVNVRVKLHRLRKTLRNMLERDDDGSR